MPESRFFILLLFLFPLFLPAQTDAEPKLKSAEKDSLWAVKRKKDFRKAQDLFEEKGIRKIELLPNDPSNEPTLTAWGVGDSLFAFKMNLLACRDGGNRTFWLEKNGFDFCLEEIFQLPEPTEPETASVKVEKVLFFGKEEEVVWAEVLEGPQRPAAEILESGESLQAEGKKYATLIKNSLLWKETDGRVGGALIFARDLKQALEREEIGEAQLFETDSITVTSVGTPGIAELLEVIRGAEGERIVESYYIRNGELILYFCTPFDELSETPDLMTYQEGQTYLYMEGGAPVKWVKSGKVQDEQALFEYSEAVYQRFINLQARFR